jgi:predicted dinucleotide-binding enzyme
MAHKGDLTGKVVVATTNQFGSGPMPQVGQTAASFNAQRMPGARYVKSFNTLTSRFQEQAASSEGADRVVQCAPGHVTAAVRDSTAVALGNQGLDERAAGVEGALFPTG